MRSFAYVGSVGVWASWLSGCSKDVSFDRDTSPSPSDSTGSHTSYTGPSTSSTHVRTTTMTPRSTVAPDSNCPGKRLGQYSWGTDLWREGSTEFSGFFGSQAGKDWGCGDIYINIGDYTAPTVIAFEEDLVPFIQGYREASSNWESVVWLTYGDVESNDGSLMSVFVDTFFNWAGALSVDTVETLGSIGLSFDVEHMDPASTKIALKKAQSLKESTNFQPGTLLVQHTIEGRVNSEGTDYVMKYADSALMMLYRNYMESSTFNSDSNILSRAAFMLKDQCVHCLDDDYAIANYNAKLTIMIEASCNETDYCGKISFCAHDTKGADYAWSVLQELETGMFSSGLVTPDQFDRLFNPLTTYAVHDWYWFRCYEPLSDSVSYSSCANYHSAAQTCRETISTVSTTPSP